MKIRILLLGMVLLLSGCGDDAELPPSPEQLAMREAAWRQACAARQIEAGAVDDVETLEATIESLDPADPIQSLSRRATGAALEFGRAFERHAELRTRAYAYLDSAVNHASTTADSSRYIERAGTFSIRSPDPETVEANVLASYQERLQTIMSDEDNRCNWDTPF